MVICHWRCSLIKWCLLYCTLCQRRPAYETDFHSRGLLLLLLCCWCCRSDGPQHNRLSCVKNDFLAVILFILYYIIYVKNRTHVAIMIKWCINFRFRSIPRSPRNQRCQQICMNVFTACDWPFESARVRPRSRLSRALQLIQKRKLINIHKDIQHIGECMVRCLVRCAFWTDDDNDQRLLSIFQFCVARQNFGGIFCRI